MASLVNAIVCFAGASLFALLAARAAGDARLAKWILALPFAKVLLDLARGPSGDAFVRSSYAGGHWQGGSFQVGFGVNQPAVASFEGHLSANAGGGTYALSVGDFAGHALYWMGGRETLAALSLGVALVSGALLARRAVSAIRFEREQTRESARATPLAHPRAGGVAIFVTQHFEGTPFTAGLVTTRVWVPEGAIAALTPSELDAALLHELSHARRRDVWFLFALFALADLLWFLPGKAALARLVADRVEQVADRDAVLAGASPTCLARAIATLASPSQGAPRAALRARPGGLRGRVDRLLAPERRSPLALRLLRAALCFALVTLVLSSSFLGYV